MTYYVARSSESIDNVDVHIISIVEDKDSLSSNVYGKITTFDDLDAALDFSRKDAARYATEEDTYVMVSIDTEEETDELAYYDETGREISQEDFEAVVWGESGAENYMYNVN